MRIVNRNEAAVQARARIGTVVVLLISDVSDGVLA